MRFRQAVRAKVSETKILRFSESLTLRYGFEALFIKEFYIYMINNRKCAIIGCGFVGATSAYSLMQSHLFSEMVLIDIDTKKAEGEAADLNHGLPFNAPMDIYAGTYADIHDASIIIITAGANQKPGQTRIDLVRTNANIFRSIVDNIIKYNTEAILLVVTNPVDILSYVTFKISGYPSNRVIGSGTVLDTARLKYLVGRKLGVDYRNVHTFIIGEHGDSELAVWSSANVSGIDLDKYCESNGIDSSKEALHEFYDDVKNSAYRIIEAKGATYYAIAESVRRIVSAIVRDEDTVLPVSAYVENYHGINNISMSLPCIVGRSGIKKVIDIPLDSYELSALKNSAKTLHGVIESLDAEILV